VKLRAIPACYAFFRVSFSGQQREIAFSLHAVWFCPGGIGGGGYGWRMGFVR